MLVNNTNKKAPKFSVEPAKLKAYDFLVSDLQ